MDSASTTKSTPRLFSEWMEQARLLLIAEIALFQAELAERTRSAVGSLVGALAGCLLLFAGFVVFLVAISLFLERLGIPRDVAFLLVAVVVMVVGALLLLSGARGLRPSRLAPTRTLAQITSLLKGL
jgi:hypothetical protein